VRSVLWDDGMDRFGLGFRGSPLDEKIKQNRMQNIDEVLRDIVPKTEK